MLEYIKKSTPVHIYLEYSFINCTDFTTEYTLISCVLRRNETMLAISAKHYNEAPDETGGRLKPEMIM